MDTHASTALRATAKYSTRACTESTVSRCRRSRQYKYCCVLRSCCSCWSIWLMYIHRAPVCCSLTPSCSSAAVLVVWSSHITSRIAGSIREPGVCGEQHGGARTVKTCRVGGERGCVGREGKTAASASLHATSAPRRRLQGNLHIVAVL
eukprot:364604-Chlamydomonas_euryale.AAC.4